MSFSTESEFNSFVEPLKQQGFTHVPVVRETLAVINGVGTLLLACHAAEFIGSLAR